MYQDKKVKILLNITRIQSIYLPCYHLETRTCTVILRTLIDPFPSMFQQSVSFPVENLFESQ